MSWQLDTYITASRNKSVMKNQNHLCATYKKLQNSSKNHGPNPSKDLESRSCWDNRVYRWNEIWVKFR